MTIVPPGSTTQSATAPTEPGAADADAVESFNAQMDVSPEDAAVKQATDAQIASLLQGDVARLREKWGTDEVGFREEAYGYWEFSQSLQNSIVLQMMQDGFTRMQEWSDAVDPDHR